MKRLITRLRPACTADSDDIYNVHRYAVRYTCLESYDREILDAWLALLSPAHYPAAIRSSSKAVWVIELHERIHGFFQLDLAQAQLDALYVLPFVHRRGLGTALLQRAEALAAEAGLGMLSLYASNNSVPFYLLNGYRALGDATMPLNRRISARCQLMRKHLCAGFAEG